MDNLVVMEGMKDKLFRGITRDLLKLIRRVQSECNAWFEANSTPMDDVAAPEQNQGMQALSLRSIFLVDGSWSAESHFSGWMKLENINS